MKVIDRKQAAQILRISTRTLDRYIQKGIIRKKEVGGRIFINIKDIKPLLSKSRYTQLNSENLENLDQINEFSASNQPHSAVYTDNSYSNTSNNEPEDNNQVYKNLYAEAVEELKLKQERLEGAQYKVGQLEALLKETVPLIEYKKAIAIEEVKRSELETLLLDFEKNTQELNESLDQKAMEMIQLKEQLHFTKTAKTIFMIILIILFLLQPLWLLFPPVI